MSAYPCKSVFVRGWACSVISLSRQIPSGSNPVSYFAQSGNRVQPATVFTASEQKPITNKEANIAGVGHRPLVEPSGVTVEEVAYAKLRTCKHPTMHPRLPGGDPARPVLAFDTCPGLRFAGQDK
jgi:hypothetical protein